MIWVAFRSSSERGSGAGAGGVSPGAGGGGRGAGSAGPTGVASSPLQHPSPPPVSTPHGSVCHAATGNRTIRWPVGAHGAGLGGGAWRRDSVVWGTRTPGGRRSAACPSIPRDPWGGGPSDRHPTKATDRTGGRARLAFPLPLGRLGGVPRGQAGGGGGGGEGAGGGLAGGLVVGVGEVPELRPEDRQRRARGVHRRGQGARRRNPTPPPRNLEDSGERCPSYRSPPWRRQAFVGEKD